MSREHRRPLVAFVVVSIVCAVMLGHGVRTDALVGLLGPRVSSSAAQNEPTVTVRDTAPSVAPTSRATGLPGLSAERVVPAPPSPSPTSAPTPTATAVVRPAAPAIVVPILVVTPTSTPTPTPPPTAVTPEVDDQGAQPAVVAARKAAREAAKQAEKALDAAARAAAKAAKHGLVPSAFPTTVPAL